MCQAVIANQQLLPNGVIMLGTGECAMAVCVHCGKPPFYEVDGKPVCIDCNLKIQQAFQIRDNALKQEMNFLLDQADAMTGLSGVMPRYKIQNPVIHRGPLNFHSITVDRSVVGAINTGNVKKMEVALNNVHAQNEYPELETALKKFTEDVLREASLKAEVKDDIVEQLSVLTAQAAMSKESRVAVVMKALVTSIGANIVSTGLVNHWAAIAKMLGF
jgi:hypothetical protein